MFRIAVLVSLLVVSNPDASAEHTRASIPAAPAVTPSAVLSSAGTARFAVIGDYGYAGANEQAVANMVSGWNPDFIITTGDNNYDTGSAATIDPNIGQYYSNYIYPYTGGFTPTVAITRNLFFPTLGNHDWNTPSATPYLGYFVLPGNERYYDFIWGPVHFYVLDSDVSEPDGNTAVSVQGNWLTAKLSDTRDPWKLVYLHHAPFSSGGIGRHGNSSWMQWPYQTWGAIAVLSGHEHDYERIVKDGFAYFVNGVGGRSLKAFTASVEPGSEFRFADNYGAMLVTADITTIKFDFYSISNTASPLDTYTLTKPTIIYFPLLHR